MIEYKVGNILTENVEVIVNAVNCVGVMGRGLALQFKKAFPENFVAYAAACREGLVVPGRMFLFERSVDAKPRHIVNFPPKRHWRDNSLMEDIDSGLVALRMEVESRQIQSIAIPPLGCGLGGLCWENVRPKIETTFADMQNVSVILFGPV